MPLEQHHRKQIFVILGGTAIASIALLLCYYIFALIQPHIATFFWSICTALVLHQVKLRIVFSLEFLSSNINSTIKRIIMFIFLANFIICVYFFIAEMWNYLTITERVVYIVIALLYAFIFLLPFVLDQNTFATVLTLFGVFIIAVLLMVGVVKTCYRESVMVTSTITSVVETYREQLVSALRNSTTFTSSNDTQLVVGVHRYNSSAMHSLPEVWKAMDHYCQMSMGLVYTNYNLIQRFKSLLQFDLHPTANKTATVDELKREFCHSKIVYLQDNLSYFALQVANLLTSHVGLLGSSLTNFFKTAMDFVNGFTEFLLQIFLFFVTLYYFVQYDYYFIQEIPNLSPFTTEESEFIIHELTSKVVRTFHYSLIMAVVRSTITAVCFLYAEIEIMWIFSFLSGFLSIIPILSNWMIWLPATIYLIARDGPFSTSWLFVLLMHTVAAYVFDTYLYKNVFKDQNPTVLGLAIVLAVYQFGPVGVITGPLIFGLAHTLIEIYKKYTTLNEEALKALRRQSIDRMAGFMGLDTMNMRGEASLKNRKKLQKLLEEEEKDE